MIKRLKTGTVIRLAISRRNIDESDPCKKENCMLTRAFTEYLNSIYGSAHYYVKSTTNGCKFTLGEYRYEVAFPSATAKKIFNYDCVYKKTHDKAKTRASVRPFRSRVVITGSSKIPPPVTAEKRKYLNNYQNKTAADRRAKGLPSRRYTGQREISL